MNPQNPPKQIEIAAALDVSPAAVSQFKKQGMPTHSIEAAKAWRDQTRNPAQRKADAAANPLGQQHGGGGGGGETFDSARRRLMIAQADKADMEAEETRGYLIRVDAVRDVMIRMISGVRDHLLTLPYRLGPLLAAESNQDRVIDQLREEMYSALTHMSSSEFSLSAKTADGVENAD